MSYYNKVKDFHKKFNINVASSPGFPSKEERELRKNLLKEEYEEYLAAEEMNDLIEVADGLGDMAYIIAGTAAAYGIDLDRVFNEIHSSNMSKLDEDGLPIYREDGKILKGPNFFRPDIKSILYSTPEKNTDETPEPQCVFSIDQDLIQDTIAMYGKEFATDQLLDHVTSWVNEIVSNIDGNNNA